ncbi:MAG: HDIG domain-containing protein [Planctomycetes bacterium]|nr:HDIG domain-containing protein [Planctomycetota bacterium]
MTRNEAWTLLNNYTANESLIKHALAVEAAMRHYAGLLGGDVDTWGLVGLIHDFDYERWPEPPDHTREGAKVLRDRGVDEEIIGCILSHAEWNLDEYPRDTPMRKALFAVDELAGFLVAVALVRPDKLEGMKVSSVKKKMKQKAFAAAVKREDIINGAELLGITVEEHIGNCITALDGIKNELGLN